MPRSPPCRVESLPLHRRRPKRRSRRRRPSARSSSISGSEQTRRQVKGVDIAGGLVTLAIGVLAYLLAAAVIDHWLIVGGLGFWGRLLLWLGLVGAAGTYFVAPAAAAAAASHQSDLRRRHDREEPADAEEQPDQFPAAPRPAPGSGRRRSIRRWSTAPRPTCPSVQIEVAVDRTHVIRLGCVLVGGVGRVQPLPGRSRRRVRSARPRGSCGRGRPSRRPRA